MARPDRPLSQRYGPTIPRGVHVHIHEASPEWYSRTSFSIRQRPSRLSSPSAYYHEDHGWRSPEAVRTEALTPQTISFRGRLTEVRTLQPANKLPRQLSGLTLGLTVADCWEFTSEKLGNQPGASKISVTVSVMAVTCSFPSQDHHNSLHSQSVRRYRSGLDHRYSRMYMETGGFGYGKTICGCFGMASHFSLGNDQYFNIGSHWTSEVQTCIV